MRVNKRETQREERRSRRARADRFYRDGDLDGILTGLQRPRGWVTAPLEWEAWYDGAASPATLEFLLTAKLLGMSSASDPNNPTIFKNKREGRAFLARMNAQRVTKNLGTPGATNYYEYVLSDGSRWSEFESYGEIGGDGEPEYTLQRIEPTAN